jgi:hypothetical protein
MYQKTGPRDAADAIDGLLVGHVPLTLLIDLTTTLDSHDIYDHEPGSADWLVAIR